MTNQPENTAQPAASPLDIPQSHHGTVIADLLGVKVELGLSDEEARVKLRSDGPNLIEGKAADNWWLVFLRQFSSIVVWLLLAAAIVSLFTHGLSEALAILIVLLINALIGFYVEFRASKALAALKKVTETRARVRRGGADKIIDSTELVVGDIIALAAGDKVPADARLLEASDLQTDESALTGESLPVIKSIDSVSFSSILTERTSMLYLGTIVVKGRGAAVITATGIQSEIGRIGRLLEKTRSGMTPLERRLATLGKRLVYLVLAIGTAIFLIGLARGDNPALMFEVAVSLAVAAVPEGLPAMTTLILALGVLRLARNRAIVRKLSSVETLGSTTVICTDKTGTLTENRLSVREYCLANGEHISPDQASIDDPLLERLLLSGILCSDASIRPGGADAETIGDPTETALLVLAESLRMNVAAERSRFDRVSERPFDAASKRMIVSLKDHESGQIFAVVKGAPQVVLDMCGFYAEKDGRKGPIDESIRKRFISINDEEARLGLRVLAFAEKQLTSPEDSIDDGYTFLGFAGMSDAARPEVPEAIRAAQRAGIRIVMLTGDQELTARAIATELELGNGQTIASFHARDIVDSTDSELAAVAREAHVFARVSPEDKLRIVEALQNAGEIVAVTGDGINDAPALKKADIGIAMGLRGTEVAKEAADIVLTDDNFSTIVSAIEGGRTIYANIIKFVHFMFAKNLAEVLLIFAAMLAGLPLPLLPLQILWLNLVTDSFLAFGLAVEPSSRETMSRLPRPSGEALLSRPFLILIAWQGVMLAAITLSAYVWAFREYGEGPHARTIALLAVVGVQLGHLFNCRSRVRSAFENFSGNPYIFVCVALAATLQIAAVYFTSLSKVLDLVEPNSRDLLVTLGCILLPVILVEIAKFVSRRLEAG